MRALSVTPKTCVPSAGANFGDLLRRIQHRDLGNPIAAKIWDTRYDRGISSRSLTPRISVYSNPIMSSRMENGHGH
jgi:hypothetical protein